MAIDETKMDHIESTAMNMLLAGDHLTLANLHHQLRAATVSAREYTGVGFFTKFSVPEGIPRLEGVKRLVIGDVYADMEDMAYGVGFLLFVKDGALNMLECFCNGDQYPEHPVLTRIYYMGPKSTVGSLTTLKEVVTRDLDFAFGKDRPRPAGH